MKTRIKMLKVKIKSLAAEAPMIRMEERRAKGRRLAEAFVGRDDALREELYRHRLDVVRPEQRASLLAYAFLRGRPLATVEKKCRPGNEPDWKRVGQLVEKFGVVYTAKADKEAQADRLREWRDQAAAV